MKNHIKTSKFLSLVLRHRPERIGLELDENGWAKVEDLLDKLPFALDADTLKEIVDTSDKKRFALSDDLKIIRANQGHSIKIDLQLIAIEPPETLFHGTPAKNIPSIQSQGLHKSKRHHVHLSADEETAHKVGSRRGRPVILKVRALDMHQAGHAFYLSENGVWLTGHVPAAYLIFEK